VFQDSLMNMYHQLDQFRGETYFGRWLRRIVVTRSLMHLRSPWRRAQQWLWGEREAEIAADGAAPLQDDAAAQLDAERLLARLTPTARAVVWLHTVEGYSHEEIAAQFGRSTSFSKTQLARALQRLRASAQPQQESELWDPAKKPSRV
jgi:RNA polymerase sigma-70 factor (ECF subfamily)